MIALNVWRAPQRGRDEGRCPNARTTPARSARSGGCRGEPGGDLERRSGLAARTGEVGSLGRSFDGLAASLEGAEEDRRRFLQDVVHELKTPLAVIDATTSAVLDGVYRHEDRHLETIRGQARQLTRIVDDLRTIGLADSGVLPLRPVPTPLARCRRSSRLPSPPRRLRLAARSWRTPGHLVARRTRKPPPPGHRRRRDIASRHAPGSRSRGRRLPGRRRPHRGPRPRAGTRRPTSRTCSSVLPGRPVAGPAAGRAARAGLVKAIAVAHGGTRWSCGAPLGGARFWIDLRDPRLDAGPVPVDRSTPDPRADDPTGRRAAGRPADRRCGFVVAAGPSETPALSGRRSSLRRSRRDPGRIHERGRAPDRSPLGDGEHHVPPSPPARSRRRSRARRSGVRAGRASRLSDGDRAQATLPDISGEKSVGTRWWAQAEERPSQPTRATWRSRPAGRRGRDASPGPRPRRGMVGSQAILRSRRSRPPPTGAAALDPDRDRTGRKPHRTCRSRVAGGAAPRARPACTPRATGAPGRVDGPPAPVKPGGGAAVTRS